MNDRPAHLLVGTITRPHGIKGEVFVAPATDRVDEVFREGRTLGLGDREGAPLDPGLSVTVASARRYKRGLIVEFADITDRNAAEALAGRTLLIPESEAEPLDPGEYFLHDLVDLEVRTTRDRVVGRITVIYSGAATPLLGVATPDGEVVIPFVSAFVREVDLETRRVVIEPPPGLPGL